MKTKMDFMRDNGAPRKNLTQRIGFLKSRRRTRLTE